MADQLSAEDRKLLDTLTELGGGRTGDSDIEQHGSKLVLPSQLTPQKAVEFLSEYIEAQEQESVFQRAFPYRPWDGAAAVERALQRVFGTAGIGRPTFSFFGSTPPERRTVEVGPNGETISVPWGEIEVPMLEGVVALTSMNDKEAGPLFSIYVVTKKKHAAAVEGFFRVIAEELDSNSIYRGKAIDGSLSFLDLAGVDQQRVIYTDTVQTQLAANLWSVIEHADTMRELELPLKRAVLLHGPYGTGKTLAAFLTACVAVEHGWTFLYCRPGKDKMPDVLNTARMYQPAVVFFEDVDAIGLPGKADAVSHLLDLFDGIETKGTELVIVMTTNHPDRIHKGMIRPGRLDAVIEIGALDELSVERLIHALVPEELLAGVDLREVGAAMDGFLPAFCKEAIDRALRYAVAREGGKPVALTTADFVAAADGLRPQLALMEEAPEQKEQAALHRALDDSIQGAVTAVMDGAAVQEDGYKVFTIETNGKA